MAKSWLDEELKELLAVTEMNADVFAQSLYPTMIQMGLAHNPRSAKEFFKKGAYVERAHFASTVKCEMHYNQMASVPEGQKPNPEDLVKALSYGWIASTLGPEPLELYKMEDCPRKAFQPTKDLVERLRGLKPPSIEDASIFESNVWYFDFPRGVFLQPNSKGYDEAGASTNLPVYCRAAFWHPLNRILAVVLEIDKRPVYLYMNADEVDSVEYYYSDMIASEKSAAYMIGRVGEMLMLLILYYYTHQDEPQGAIERLPSAKINAATKKSKKGFKGVSLFTIDQLGIKEGDSLPTKQQKDSFGNDPYSHSFAVRGHFRWQAHGKGYLKRKLNWIAEFIKGKGDFIPKNQMTKLK